MQTRYGHSPWIDRFPKSRVPGYPKHRGPLAIDVVIVGGGLTGCATAYAFAAAGFKVAMFESDRVGRGASGASPGWIGEEPGGSFVDTERLVGLRGTRHAWQSWRRAALDFSSLLRRLKIRCELTPATALRVGVTPEQGVSIKREHKMRSGAGIEAALLTPRAVAEEAAIAANAGLRVRGNATIDPYRATLGLAAAAAARGAQIFERSPIRKVTFTRKHADVFTDGGIVRTTRVIVTTGVPTALYKALVRHVWLKNRYVVLTDVVPAKVRQLLGKREAIVRDSAAPPHVLRWVDGDRLLIAGADGDVLPERLREKTLVQRTGQLMYELSTIYPDISGVMPAYGWDAPYALTAEALPYIGPHRNFPHHLFAFGDSSHGVTGAYLASRLLLRHHLGETKALDDVFGFTR